MISSPHTDGVRLTSNTQVNELVARLRDGAIAALGPELVGFYVEGSIASGAYEHGASDIDLLVATRAPLDGSRFNALSRLHADIAASPGASVRTDVAYFPPAAMRRYDPANATHPGVNAGVFGRHHFGWDTVFNLHVARVRGIALVGPAATALIDAVSPAALRDATRRVLFHDWIPNLTNDDWLRYRHHQAFAALTMCRALHTIETGELTSKPEAAAWALASLDARWRALIERALAWRFERSPDVVDETLAFMRWTMQRAGVLRE